jgi:hypothetical protein
MIELTTSKEVDGEKRQVGFKVEPGSSLQEAVKLYGENLVYEFYTSQFRVRAQSVARRMLEAGYTDEQIKDELAKWDPNSTVRVGVDPQQAAVNRIAGGDENFIKQVLAKAKEMGIEI